jgi:V8-like Glu-specific endopeptidase
MKKKKHSKIIGNKNHEMVEYGTIFGNDENFAFIAGFTSNGAPFGITHEEMVELENEQKLSDNNDNIDLPF